MSACTADEIKVTEPKLPLINEKCVVYEYKCDLCDAGYVGKTLYFRESLSSVVPKVVVPRSTVDNNTYSG